MVCYVLQCYRCRQVFVVVQEILVILAKYNAEMGVKLNLEVAMSADTLYSVHSDAVFSSICYEFLSQTFALYEECMTDSRAQHRCVTSMVGTLLTVESISAQEYEGLVTKATQFAAKIIKKPEQCNLVALCAHLFYPITKSGGMAYSKPQRSLECLQRSLKLADACTSANPSNVVLFVDLLEHYVYFFEKKNPSITHGYISGLVSLVKEHLNNIGDPHSVTEAKAQFMGVVAYLKQKKADKATAEQFAPIVIDVAGS
jgi:vacuolar protein sorting-associated protein 35